MGTRAQNEKKFGQWEDLPGGGRRYLLRVPGRLGWMALYLKEIYDNAGTLVEVHEKFPVDKGHQKV